MQDQPQNYYTTYGCNWFKFVGFIVHIRYLLKGQHCWSIQESRPLLIQGKCVSIIVIQMQKFKPVLQVCFSQCRWCTGKAYSPSHRFSSPETKLWPSDSESPPTTSQATQAGREESEGEKSTCKILKVIQLHSFCKQYVPFNFNSGNMKFCLPNRFFY